MIIKHNGYKFLIRKRKGKIIVRVTRKHDRSFKYDVTTECLTQEAASEKAELHACLNEALKRHAAAKAQTQPGAIPDSPAEPAPPGSFLELLDSTLAQLAAKRWKKKTKVQFFAIAEFIKENLLPEENQYLPASEMDYEKYSVLAVAVNQHPTIKDSKYQTKQLLRRLTEELVNRGLPHECLRAIGCIEAKSPHQKRGQPNTDANTLAMLNAIEAKPFPIQFLFWNGFSGGPQAGDAVSPMLSEVNFVTGKVRIDRQKTGGVAEYALLIQGLKCLKEQKFGKYDIFVLQELLEPGPNFSVDELADVDALINRWLNPVDPVSDYFSERLTHADRMALVAYDPKSKRSVKKVRGVLTKTLNRAVQGSDLRQNPAFASVQSRPETKQRSNDPTPEPNPAGLNRMILEDAHPPELKRYPNEATFARLSAKAGQIWRDFLRSVGINDKTYRSFRQLITSDSLSRAVRDALVARVQGNALNAVRKYDFPEDWQFFCVRDLREQLLQSIRNGNYQNYVLTYENLVDKLKSFVGAYVDAAKDLAARRQQDLSNKIDEASVAASKDAREALSEQDQSERSRHELLMQKADLVLRRIKALERRLLALADALFGARANDALFSAVAHALGRKLTDQEVAAIERGEFPFPSEGGDLSQAA